MVPLADLAAQYRNLHAEIDVAVRRVLASGVYINGPNVAAFEKEVSAYLKVPHAVGVASGTDALVLALRALDIGAGDEVIVPAYTFFGTVEAVLRVGATPVLVDIDPETYCINVSQAVSVLSTSTKAVIAVHMYGHPADMAPLLSRGLTVIEDNAQAFGAEYMGRKTGSLGIVGCLSFFPSKNLGAAGDGGMLVTNAEFVAFRAQMLRTHGWKEKYYPLETGYNSRLDEIQAAILRVKLRHVDAWNNRRGYLAEQYSRQFASLPIVAPREADGVRHAWNYYVVRVSDRVRVRVRLQELGVETGVYYPNPLHLLPPLRHLRYSVGQFPEAERASRETMAIPIYPEMSPSEVLQVIGAIRKL